jgi:ribosomal protein S12 methylthiotransferase
MLRMTPAAEEKKFIVINTCGFIDNAKAESVNMIFWNMRIKKKGLVDKVLLPDVCRNVTDLI